jgi:hypothetical protein
MSDEALVTRLAANRRSYWERVERGERVFPEGAEFVPLNREYNARAQQRPMLPVPMPTDVPAYAAHVRSVEMSAWLDQLPRGILFAPLKSYVANAAHAATGTESDYSRGSRLKAAAVTALPVVAGGLAYHRTGSVAWTGGAAVGSVFALSAVSLLLVGLAFRGGGY